MIKAGDKIKVHFMDWLNPKKEIKTNNHDKVFVVYEKDRKLGIDWNTNKESFGYKFKNDSFASFNEFAYTVIFENVETGEKFYYSSLKNELVKVRA